MTIRRNAAILLLACLPMLGACDNGGRHDAQTAAVDNASASTANDTDLSQRALQVEESVRARLGKSDIDVSGDHATGKPKAKITADGNLLVDGRPVAVDSAQRTLLLQYRQQIIDLAAAGSAVGVYGAEIGMKATGEAVKGLFGGSNEQDIEKRLAPQTAALKRQAMDVCEGMPAMLATQQALAEILPAFRPYATMDESDVDDCRDGE